MSTLHAFLHPELPENKEIIISNRFKDESGKVQPFVIRAITQEEADRIKKDCTVTKRDRTGHLVSDFDTDKYSRLMIVAGTVTPDFSAKDLCDSVGVIAPELVPGKLLLAGEFATLSQAIGELSGLTEESESEIRNYAKN